MTNRKILLFLLSVIFIINSENVYACSLTNLTSCSFSELAQFFSDLVSLKNNEESSCPNVYLPACSKSGKTYDNLCLLKESKEKLDYLGACLEHPYNLIGSQCTKAKFDWDGYKCAKKEGNFTYTNENLGISLNLEENSKISDEYIFLPKERNNSNLYFKKLEIISGNNCSDIALYTKVNNREEVNLNGNNFEVIEGEDNLEYGDILVDVYYKEYVLNRGDSCIGFLFSMYSEKDSSFGEYDKKIEGTNFDEIIKSLSFALPKEKISPCQNYGDLNLDNIIDESDLDAFEFGSIESNSMSKGDLNGDNVIDNNDYNILKSFVFGNIETFEACSLEENDLEAVGFAPKVIFNNDFDVSYNNKKTEARVRLNFDISAEEGNAYILLDGSNLKLANQDAVKVYNFTWNTGADILDNGYIFIEKGKKIWISLEFDLKAKEKSIYTKASIDEINYINKKGEINKVSTKIETNKFYLNYVNGDNLICGNYGDINGDGIIKEDDISYIVLNKEMDEEMKARADVSGNGEVNLIDAIEIQKYLLEEVPFTICSKTFTPHIYGNAMVNGESIQNLKHIYLTFYLDSNEGDALIPSKVSINQDDESAGIYLELERDGYVKVSNLRLLSSAEPTKDGFLRLKKGLPQWIRLEFDVEAINDTALVNFKVNKMAYILDGEREYLYPEDIQTGDIFLNYKSEELNSPCFSLGDLNLDGHVSYADYEYLANDFNLLLRNKNDFERADLNRDGKIDELDLGELDDFLNKKIDKFSACLKESCSSEIKPVYTKDGFIYANECYLEKQNKELKCYIFTNCGL
ncbi:MAG: dockerin type I domain-containing protein [Candidatus Pacebacteria bacterium]|nr:dockerin type I domain-containing protein [Candidatus Paceibacterota bacterium]